MIYCLEQSFNLSKSSSMECNDKSNTYRIAIRCIGDIDPFCWTPFFARHRASSFYIEIIKFLCFWQTSCLINKSLAGLRLHPPQSWNCIFVFYVAWWHKWNSWFRIFLRFFLPWWPVIIVSWNLTKNIENGWTLHMKYLLQDQSRSWKTVLGDDRLSKSPWESTWVKSWF